MSSPFPDTDPTVPTPAPASAPKAARRAAAKPAAVAGFRQSYDLLQSHAETLRRQSEPNIDDLLTIVNESVAAYKLCKERIDAVEQALEAALSGAGVDEAAGGAAPARAEAGSGRPAPAPADAPPRALRDAGGDDGMQDDDIPF